MEEDKDLIAIRAAITMLDHVIERRDRVIEKRNRASQKTAKARIITKFARNVMPGETVELTDGRGRGEVVGWGQIGDQVTITLPGNRLASFHEEDRVRVVRA